MLDFQQTNDLRACIKVFGVGGGGGNALNNMIQQNLAGVEFYAANTDAQALGNNLAPEKLQLGNRQTSGLGAGGTPEVGRDAAQEDTGDIISKVEGADMVFVTAGMGGGTGTGAAPVIGQLARDQGALTVAVVTKPFSFEGRRRMKNADDGISRLKESVDTLIVIPNDKLLEIAEPGMSMIEAFRVADQVLFDAVKSISDIIVTPGLINVDFADVKSIMTGRGRALMGTGMATGEGRALEAAKLAVSSPLLENANIEGATGILINITGGIDLSLQEVNAAASLVEDAADNDANIIFGSVIDESMGDQVRITVIATGSEDMACADIHRASGENAVPSQMEREQVGNMLERARMAEQDTVVVEVSSEGNVPEAATAPPRRKRPKPNIFNPFSEGKASELDKPTFTRRKNTPNELLSYGDDE